MPSVEIICIGQPEPTPFKNVPFRVYAENKLRSHRQPTPLFQPDFDTLQGCIYHLVKQPKGRYTAYSLLNEYWNETLTFKPKYVPFIARILSDLLDASPQHQLLFTSDYQFGPQAKRYKRPIRLSKFWKMHDTAKLRPNTLYPLIPDKPPTES